MLRIIKKSSGGKCGGSLKLRLIGAVLAGFVGIAAMTVAMQAEVLPADAAAYDRMPLMAKIPTSDDVSYICNNDYNRMPLMMKIPTSDDVTQ